MNRRWSLHALVGGLLLSLAIPAFAQSYRILITNDDGINSPLLAVLKQELAVLPGVEVVVSAPLENQSGSSNSSVGTPLVVDQVMRDGSLFGYAVHGRPADAVGFGLSVLGAEQPFDLLVSGINDGSNVGDVAHGSGTVGAAMRAQMLGVPSIAASQANDEMDTAASARFVARLVQRYQRDGAPEGIVLSINFPAGEIKGVQVRPMGDLYLTRNYQVREQGQGTTTYTAPYQLHQAQDPESDTWAYQNGYITVTPLQFDWTAYDFLDELRSWNLQ